jgi:dehydrogenase/reductase SDR family member 12
VDAAPATQIHSPRHLAADAVDLALEATVALSFSRVGYEVRRRVYGWDPLAPPADPASGPLAGRVAIVTGASSGIGLATATRLAGLGAALRLLGRDISRTEAARAHIVTQTGNEDVEMGIADLARLEDVRQYAAQIRAYNGRLDLLVNNAGALAHRYQRTVDGLELAAQTHVVAPFLLTHELMPLLEATPRSRVLTVTSGGMYTQRLVVDRLEAGPERYDGVAAYARAKRAQVVLTRLWAQRYGFTGVHFHAMHPGWVDTPGLRAALPGFTRTAGHWLRDPDQGADTLVWLAADDEAATASNGELWLDRHRRWPHKLLWTPADPAEPPRLWTWVQERAGLTTIPGPSSVASA